MSDDVDVIAEALSTRAFTQAEEVALARVEHFVSHHDFVVQRRPRLALELLIAGVLAAVAVTLIIALTRHSPLTPSPAHHSPVPTPTPTATASPPTPSPTASSTVVASPPLAIFFTATSNESYQLQARTYSGALAGSLTIPYSDSGFEVAPDGSKVLDGVEIIAVNASPIARIDWTFATLPVWADDSQHLCGVTYDPSSGGHATLVEFDMSGTSRTVATLGPSGPNISWSVLACSPDADRVLVEGGPGAVIDLLRLSTGTVLASHSVHDDIGASVASHDGRIIAVNEPSGVAVRDTSTWALKARIVRWGAPEGYRLIGSAVTASWDGSRLLVDAGGASGACHPQWLVDWARNRNVLTSTSLVGPLGCSAVLPLTHSATFFVWTPVSGALYVVEDSGAVRKVGG